MAFADSSPKKTSNAPLSGVALLVASAFFMEFLDGTVIATALPAMARSFGVSAVDLNIGITAYLLTLAVLIPASGWLAERFGARNIFCLALALFTFASLLCGIATTVDQFVMLRIFQGVGGAMMVPVGRLVVLRTTPKDQLIKAIATLTWPALVAPIIGPALGGFITTYASWHWIFFLNVPLGLIAIAVAWRLMPSQKPDQKPPFDIIGFITTGITMLCLVTGLEMLGQQRFNLVEAVMVSGVGILALVWAVKHLLHAATPLIRLNALRVPTFRITMRGGFLLRATISAAPFMLPLMFQVGFGIDAFHAGTLVLAVFAGNLAMKPATTPLIRFFGFKKLLIGNGILCVVSLLCCALLTPDTSPFWTILVLFFGGLCRSMQFTGISSLAFAEVPSQEMSSANTLFSTSLQLASGLGITLGALCIRTGSWLTEIFHLSALPGISFRLSFIIIAAITAVALWDMTRLTANAGDNVSRKAA